MTRKMNGNQLNPGSLMRRWRIGHYRGDCFAKGFAVRAVLQWGIPKVGNECETKLQPSGLAVGAAKTVR
jgi:hypothetical protein